MLPTLNFSAQAPSEKVGAAIAHSGAGLITLCQLPSVGLADGRLLVEHQHPTTVASAGRRWRGRNPRVGGLCCAGMVLRSYEAGPVRSPFGKGVARVQAGSAPLDLPKWSGSNATKVAEATVSASLRPSTQTAASAATRPRRRAPSPAARMSLAPPDEGIDEPEPRVGGRPGSCWS